MMIFVALMLSAVAHASVTQSELQWAICEKSPEIVLAKLEAEANEEKLRKLYFLETSNQELLLSNFSIRFKASNKTKIKSSVKTQYSIDSSVPTDELAKWNVECERDIYLQKKKIGCSAKAEPDRLGRLSQNQLDLLQFSGADQKILSRAKLWGPLRNDEISLTIGNQNFSLEVAHLDEGAAVVELSTRTESSNYEQLFAKWTSYFQQKGLVLCEQQTGRSKRLLDYLMSRSK